MRSLQLDPFGDRGGNIGRGTFQGEQPTETVEGFYKRFVGDTNKPQVAAGIVPSSILSY